MGFGAVTEVQGEAWSKGWPRKRDGKKEKERDAWLYRNIIFSPCDSLLKNI